MTKGGGVSTLEIILSKAILVEGAGAASTGTYTESDRVPNCSTSKTEHSRWNEEGFTPQRNREDPAIVVNAMKIYKCKFPDLASKVNDCSSTQELEAYFDKTCSVTSSP